MVVCQNFLQGACRYGNSCRYEHPMNSNAGGGTSIMRQSSNPTTVDVATLVKSVQNDMLNSEKGGQWLLSSYAPFKEKPVFPGFEDLLFEEVRWAFYEANAVGNVDEYKRKLLETLQAAAHKVRLLQSPNEHVAQTLQQIYNAAPVDVGQPPAPLFSQPAFSPGTFPPPQGAEMACAVNFAAPSPFAASGAAHSLAFAPPPAVATLPPTAFSGGNIFAAAAANAAHSGGNIFAGAVATAPAAAASLGGGGIFASVAPPSGGGIFASAGQPSGGGMFASAVSAGPNNAMSGGGSMFAPATIAAAPPAGGNMFAGVVPTAAAPPGGGNLCAAAAATAPPSGGIFAQAMQNYGAKATENASIFGGGAAAPAAAAPAVAAPAVAAPAVAAPAAAAPAVAAPAAAAPAAAAPAAAAPAAAAPAVVAPAAAAPAVVAPVAAAPAANIFAQAAQNFVAHTTGSIFQTSTMSNSPLAAGSSPLVADVAAHAPPEAAESSAACYTVTVELAPDAVAAFDGEEFEFGGIPIMPPAINFCA